MCMCYSQTEHSLLILFKEKKCRGLKRKIVYVFRDSSFEMRCFKSPPYRERERKRWID